MSIIEKALDKALGRSEDETLEAAEDQSVPVADSEPSEEVFEAAVTAAPAAEEYTPPPAPEAAIPKQETSEQELAAGRPVHALDWQSLQSHGYVKDRESALYDRYQSIARPVLANAFPASRAGIQRGNLVLVTSSRASEGKTFTAFNLALGIALEDPARKVLLVDADTEKTSLSRLLGLSDQTGLSELLESKNQRLQDLALRTDLPGLHVLSTGQVKQKPHGILAGAAIMKFAKELAKRHPDLLVIFDGPSLLEVAETASLAMQVGQVLVVVEVEMTPRVVVREAIAKLEFCNVVGCVLNKAAEPASGDIGDLAFGYGLYQPQYVEG